MEKYRPWKRNYPIPEDLPYVFKDNAGLAGWRTERLENPDQVFIDIYGLLDYLTQTGNMQLRGRRGTGKTMYFLKGQHHIGSSFINGTQNRIISAYVDLKNIHHHNEIPSYILRAEMIYLEVIRSLAFGIENQQGMRRFNLKDYIEKVDFTRRWGINNALKEIKEITKTPIEQILPDHVYDSICEHELQLLQNSGSTINETSLTSNLDDYYLSNRSLINDLRKIENGTFSTIHRNINKLLLKILDGLKVHSLILFVDELSSPTIIQGIQVPLIDRMVSTFPGDRLSIKIATVPGTSIVYENVKKSESSDKNEANSFSTFDFETQALKQPDIIETGNFEVFLRNLANIENRYLEYLDPAQPENGFNRFLDDIFENYNDFLEFIKAGEGLPRQMLETFFNANTIRKNSNPDGKLNSLHLQISSRQSLQITYQSQILGSNKCEEILSKIYQVNNRVMKIERIPEYNTSIDLLTHWGFIHACPIPATIEPALSKYPLEYFYTSYRMEIANQMSHAKEKASQTIDDLSTVQKDKLKELYPKAKAVILSDIKSLN